MKKKTGMVMAVLCYCCVSMAQQVISSGGYEVKSEVSVNWILGGSLSDIAPIDQNVLDKLRKDEMMESMISLKVYPVPARDFINIEATPIDTGRLTLELFNNAGVKVLHKMTVYQPVIRVDIQDIPSGAYFLKVLSSNSGQHYKVEKIIKK